MQARKLAEGATKKLDVQKNMCIDNSNFTVEEGKESTDDEMKEDSCSKNAPAEQRSDSIALPKNHVLLPNVQTTIQTVPSRKEGDKSELSEIQEKLDILLSKMKILLDLKGTGLTFYSSNFDGGIVRCETCFEYACENPPGVLNTNLDSSNKQLSLGNTFAVGISLNKEKVEALIAGGNQKWYSFKSMMLDHVGCSTARNGDFSHYKALVAQKQSRKIKNTVQSIVSSQLKGALTVVKVKAASLHYENIIGLLQSCGVNIGNIGHGRKQMNAMLQAFQTYIFKKTRALLQTPMPSTGLPPHSCTASYKSTPARLSNHAIMVLTMVNGENAAVPLYAPTVYSFQDSYLEGGTARELAKQVIASLCETIKLPATSLSFLVAHQADGQYQAADFRRELIDVIQAGMVPSNKCSEHENFFIVAWDTAQWIDCGFNDIREKEAGSVLRRLIRRCNKFQSMFARGRGYAEYHGYT